MTEWNANESAERLAQLLAEAGQEALEPAVAEGFSRYLELLMRWNARTNLTAVRDAEGILRRHFVESIAVARYLPVTCSSLLDFGSGAGFPGIPVALCRMDLTVTLAESQGKKAAFLMEASRQLGIAFKVHAKRAEELKVRFDCVTLRAVDRMQAAVQSAAGLVASGGWLAPLTTLDEISLMKEAAGEGFQWLDPQSLPGSDQRVLLLGKKQPVAVD